jgi:hypothetical protein
MFELTGELISVTIKTPSAHFVSTVIDAKGVRAASTSPPRRMYATVSIADHVLKTGLAETNDDPQWNHTLSL